MFAQSRRFLTVGSGIRGMVFGHPVGSIAPSLDQLCWFVSQHTTVKSVDNPLPTARRGHPLKALRTFAMSGSSSPAASSAASDVSSSARRKVHAKPQQFVDELNKITEARKAAHKVVRDLRMKQKKDAKKHKRLMSKASRLSVDELKAIAEMKQACIGGLSTASSSPAASAASVTSTSSSSSAAPADVVEEHSEDDP